MQTKKKKICWSQNIKKKQQSFRVFFFLYYFWPYSIRNDFFLNDVVRRHAIIAFLFGCDLEKLKKKVIFFYGACKCKKKEKN